MADYAISNVPRRVVYAASGTGPYAFTFEILDETDIAVYKASTLLTLTTDYTVTINTNGTGEVTLVASAGTSNITIVGAKNIQRTSDFTTGGDLFANTLNDELDNQTIFIQQVAETAERGLKAPVTDPTDIAMTLPAKASRAGKTLAFDANGNPVVGEDIGNWRGNWASGTSYTVRDLVKDASNYNVYRCNTAHTSTGTTPISSNADSAKWDLVIDAEYAAEQAQDAADSATAAASSASAASSSASAASSSASAASTSATNAASSASTASTQATNAANSASAAATSATNASNSATAAATSATNASNSASAASTSATNAANSATAASGSASTASTQATNAANSASAASTSATNASNSATAAATSATNASNSATAAATSATNASNSASAADSSAVAAAASAAAAAASYDSFDDRYLGSKTSAPATDNDGNALVVGALYYSSTTGKMNVYDGGTWIEASAASQAILVVYQFTATGGQTTFSGTDNNSLTLGYTVGSALVTLNGVMLEVGSEVTASSGTSVVLASGATAGDELNVYAFSTFNLADVYTKAQSDARYPQIDTNTLYVDATNNRVGIGTSSPLVKLEVNGNNSLTGAQPTHVGNIRITDNPTAVNATGGLEFFTSNFASGYGWKMSSIDSSGVHLSFATRQNSATWTEQMRIDSSGRVTITNQPAFRAIRTTGFTTSATTWFEIAYNSNVFDRNNNYNTSNGRFTAPVTGTYMFCATTQPTSSGQYVEFKFFVNGVGVPNTAVSWNNQPARGDLTLALVVLLNAGDYISANVYTSGTMGFDNNGQFSGHLIG
jgi:hypothetical protein